MGRPKADEFAQERQLVATRLKFERIQSKMSQKDVAELIGVSERTYCDYENGVAGISIDKLRRLAKYYDVSMDYISAATTMRRHYPCVVED